MADPTEFTVSDVVQAAVEQKPVQLATAFDALVRDQIAPELEEIENSVSFSDPVDVDFDDDFDAEYED